MLGFSLLDLNQSDAMIELCTFLFLYVHKHNVFSLELCLTIYYYYFLAMQLLVIRV